MGQEILNLFLKETIDFKSVVHKQEAHLNKSGLDLGVIYESNLIANPSTEKPLQPTDNYKVTTYHSKLYLYPKQF